MKITKNRLKQIIKEEIEALGEAGFTSLSTGPGIEVTDEDIEAAEKLFAQIKDNKVNVRMKNVIANIDDDDKFYGLKEQYLNFLKNNILIAFPEYKEFSEGAKAHIMNLIENDLDDYVYDMAVYGEPMNESIGGLMKDLGYEKARKAVASAIDFDEKVENMEDLKALIAKLRSEKDPMGRGRKEELDDIEKALRNISEAMSDDEYKQKEREKDKQGVYNELTIGMDVPKDIITDDLLNAIMAHEDYIPGEVIDKDSYSGYSSGFITADEVMKLAKELELKKRAERSYLSEKLKRIIKEEIGRFLNEDEGTYIDLSGYGPEVVINGERTSLLDMMDDLRDAKHPLGSESLERIDDDGRTMEVVNAFLEMNNLNPEEVERREY